MIEKKPDNPIDSKTPLYTDIQDSWKQEAKPDGMNG
jgi:hypothetical protein